MVGVMDLNIGEFVCIGDIILEFVIDFVFG